MARICTVLCNWFEYEAAQALFDRHGFSYEVGEDEASHLRIDLFTARGTLRFSIFPDGGGASELSKLQLGTMNWIRDHAPIDSDPVALQAFVANSKFAIGCNFHSNDGSDSDDGFEAWILAFAEKFDGIVFDGSTLRNLKGEILLE